MMTLNPYLSKMDKTKEYYRMYHEAKRNRLRHIRKSFVKTGKHEENKCKECIGKRLLDWREYDNN